MALGTTLALMLLSQGTGIAADMTQPEPVDVAFEELVGGANSAAIARIEQNTELASDDPARLINLGIAHARQGSEVQAREMFTAAAINADRYQLETAQGDWVDSRVLARRALAMLSRGEFRDAGRMASR